MSFILASNVPHEIGLCNAVVSDVDNNARRKFFLIVTYFSRLSVKFNVPKIRVMTLS